MPDNHMTSALMPNRAGINADVARAVAQSMLREPILSASRIPFGNVNFVFDITAESGSYVLRMTTPEWKKAYVDAIALQKILIPLGVPVASFIENDVAGEHSPYPALLMHKLSGTDLVNVYRDLPIYEKLALADNVAAIHRMTGALPLGRGYGFAAAGADAPYASWAAFLHVRWDACMLQTREVGALSAELAREATAAARAAISAIGHIPSTPFIWDMADRNLMIDQGGLTGIVDVDNLCYGDPLYTVSLASAVFDKEAWDTTYVDRWLTNFQDEKNTEGSVALRFAFYRLFWLLNCLRSSGQLKGNGNREQDRKERLSHLIKASIKFVEKIIATPNPANPIKK
jgi:Ser/Thr protein kinase RdoA (MazF antagonist)